MSEFNPSPKRDSIVSLTFSLVQTADGARFWEPLSGLDESKLTVEDVAKFQYHLLHWHAAMQGVLVRLVTQAQDRQAHELALLTGEVQGLSEQVRSMRAALERPKAPALALPTADATDLLASASAPPATGPSAGS